jgi:hypothetical protein
LHGLNISRGIAAVALLALALGGCSGFSGFPGFGKTAEPPPTDPNLYPAKYRSEIATFLRTYLNNPTKVRDAYISQPTLKPYGGTNHYISCVRYNPRDNNNRYTGNETKVAEFLGGRLNQFLLGNDELCANAVYQRFPEAEVLVP